MKKLLLPSVILLLIMGCATTEPTWISDYPNNNLYYIGIGASNTGDEAMDREIAEERALTNIAASISTKLHSETQIVAEEDSNGSSSEYAKEEITAVVEQSLSGVETVEIYYSKKSGAWVYMRLSKELWEKIQKKEMAELTSRIKEFLEPSLSDDSRVLSSKVQDLVKAKELILASPYAGMLKTTLLLEKGSLIDIVDTYLKSLIESMVFSLQPETIALEVGQTTDITLEISSNGSNNVGNIPFKLSDSEGNVLFKAYTDNKGYYNGELESKGLSMGQNYVSFELDREELKMGSVFDSFNFPKKIVTADLETLTVGLNVNIQPESTSIAGIDGSVKSLFSTNDMLFKIGNEKSVYLNFEILISDFPKLNPNAPNMAKANAIISLVKNGKTIYSYESKAFKDGGINVQQAHERATAKLLLNLNKSNDYLNEISNALSVN